MVVPALPALQRELDASTTWVTWVLTGFLLVGVGADADPRQARRPVRQGAAARRVARDSSSSAASAARPRRNIWSLIAFRVVSGAGGAVFPLSFGDHPRRVPARADEGRDRAALGGVRRRRRVRARALRRDRRQRRVALALRASARSASRSRSCSCTASCPSRPSARRRASTCPGALLLSRRARVAAARACPRARAGAGRRPRRSGCSRLVRRAPWSSGSCSSSTSTSR